MDAAAKRLDASLKQKTVLHALEQLFWQLPLAVAVLDKHLHPIYLNPAARGLCRLWSIGPQARFLKTEAGAGPFGLPAEVREACLRLQRPFP